MKQFSIKGLQKPLMAAALVVVGGAMVLTPLAGVYASSHREAPLLTGDPKADATDLYAFVSPDNKDTATIIANYSPFQNPPGGPNFNTFGDDVTYDINIDNNGDAAPDIIYRYAFKTTTQDPKTFSLQHRPHQILN